MRPESTAEEPGRDVARRNESLLSWRGLLQVLVLLGALATLLGFAGSFGWLFDLAAHFRVQYLVGFAVLFGLGLLLKQRRLAWACAALALVNAATLWPLASGPTATVSASAGSSRWMTFNVHTANTNKAGVLAAIRAAGADVVALQEVDSAWMLALLDLRTEYPYAVAEPREDNFGICLLSRWPIAGSNVFHWGAAEVPSLEVRLQSPAGIVTAIATHPVPPVGRHAAAARDEQLSLLARRVRELSGPVVVLGDLNTTPWGASFRRLVADSGLRDSARGQGWQPTWPSFQPLLFIPLDHVLATPDIGVVSRSVGDAAGSDHRPVVVELAW